VYVTSDTGMQPPSCGDTPQTACGGLVSGVAVAQPGDTLELAPGFYAGQQSVPLYLRSPLSIVGRTCLLS